MERDVDPSKTYTFWKNSGHWSPKWVSVSSLWNNTGNTGEIQEQNSRKSLLMAWKTQNHHLNSFSSTIKSAVLSEAPVYQTGLNRETLPVVSQSKTKHQILRYVPLSSSTSPALQSKSQLEGEQWRFQQENRSHEGAAWWWTQRAEGAVRMPRFALFGVMVEVLIQCV